LAERVAAVPDGESQRAAIEAGLQADQPWRGKVHFVIVGWRAEAGTTEVLYAVATNDNGPSTPYPLIGQAVQDGGGWFAGAQYACGLQGLTNGACAGAPGEAPAG
jgi:hypothetical protein